MNSMPCSRRVAWHLMLLLAVPALSARAADAPLPQRELIVEWRDAVADGAGTGWDASSTDAARNGVSRRLRVRNGQSTSLRLTQTRPVQAWQALPGLWRPVAAPATVWMTAGQEITVQPRWPGAGQPVSVALELASARFDPNVAPGSGEPPQRHQEQLTTTVSAPLGSWITLATSADPDPAMNVVGTRNASAASQRVLQLRVNLAP